MHRGSYVYENTDPHEGRESFLTRFNSLEHLDVSNNFELPVIAVKRMTIVSIPAEEGTNKRMSLASRGLKTCAVHRFNSNENRVSNHQRDSKRSSTRAEASTKEYRVRHFRIGKRIGSGSFGDVRIGRNEQTHEMVAVKLELTRCKAPQLALEYRIYKKIGDVDGFPKCFCYDTVSKYNALVIELLGPSLEDLLDVCDNKFSVKTTAQIAIQCLDRIEFVHGKGLIYRDIKPENFLIGRHSHKRNHIVHLVDFGLAKDYIDPTTKKHIPPKGNKSLVGTARYMSINTHDGKEQGRRDDLESLGHMFMYFLRGILPWQNLKAENLKLRYKRIGETKRRTTVDELCDGYPSQFKEYLHYARKLEFSAQPNYSYCRKLFHDVLNSIGAQIDNDFDWNEELEKSVQRQTEKQLEKEEELSDANPNRLLVQTRVPEKSALTINLKPAHSVTATGAEAIMSVSSLQNRANE